MQVNDWQNESKMQEQFVGKEFVKATRHESITKRGLNFTLNISDWFSTPFWTVIFYLTSGEEVSLSSGTWLKTSDLSGQKSWENFYFCLVGLLFGFYGVSTFLGYLTPNSVYMYIHSTKDF